MRGALEFLVFLIVRDLFFPFPFIVSCLWLKVLSRGYNIISWYYNFDMLKQVLTHYDSLLMASLVHSVIVFRLRFFLLYFVNITPKCVWRGRCVQFSFISRIIFFCISWYFYLERSTFYHKTNLFCFPMTNYCLWGGPKWVHSKIKFDYHKNWNLFPIFKVECILIMLFLVIFLIRRIVKFCILTCYN